MKKDLTNVPKLRHRFRIRRRLSTSAVVFAGAMVAALCGPEPAFAQARPSVVAQSKAPAGPLIEYSANESGGRIKLVDPNADPTTVEAIRVHLLENAAAIRRGDFRSIQVVRTDLPAIRILTDRRAAIRCTVRVTANGAELVMLSDDDAVVAAIHQLLASTPPTQIQL